jgi:hypothetical protein
MLRHRSPLTVRLRMNVAKDMRGQTRRGQSTRRNFRPRRTAWRQGRITRYSETAPNGWLRRLRRPPSRLAGPAPCGSCSRWRGSKVALARNHPQLRAGYAPNVQPGPAGERPGAHGSRRPDSRARARAFAGAARALRRRPHACLAAPAPRGGCARRRDFESGAGTEPVHFPTRRLPRQQGRPASEATTNALSIRGMP